MVGRQARSKGRTVEQLQAGIDRYLDEDDAILRDATEAKLTMGDYIRAGGVEDDVVAMAKKIDDAYDMLAQATRMLQRVRAQAFLATDGHLVDLPGSPD